MKNTYISKTDVRIIAGLLVFIIVMIVVSLSIKEKIKSETLVDTMIYINPEKCSYYDTKDLPCPWDIKKSYKVLVEYSYNNKEFLIVLDNEIHRSIDIEYILVPYVNSE